MSRHETTNEGTAFAFYKGLRSDGGFADDPFDVGSIRRVAERLARLLDPADLHTIKIQYSDSVLRD